MRTHLTNTLRRGTAISLAGLVMLTGCSSNDPPASEGASSKSDKAPAAGVKPFCDEFADVLDQDDPDFSRLEQAAPEAVKPEVTKVVEFSEMATTAEEAPEESVIEEFERSVAGMTIYAVDECDDADAIVEGLGIGDSGLDAIRKYSLDDVRDDETWPEIKAALDQ